MLHSHYPLLSCYNPDKYSTIFFTVSRMLFTLIFNTLYLDVAGAVVVAWLICSFNMIFFCSHLSRKKYLMSFEVDMSASDLICVEYNENFVYSYNIKA